MLIASILFQRCFLRGTSLSFRYRYEFVDQDGVANDTGNASTLKSRITYTSEASYNNLTAALELDNVTLIGNENYRTPTNGNLGYPIVADPWVQISTKHVSL